jgi:hypothetical protein
MLVGLRMDEDFLRRVTGAGPGSLPDLSPEAAMAYFPSMAMRALHHAPGKLIFPSVPDGTTIEIKGMGPRALRFEVPSAPAEVVMASGDKASSKTSAPLRAELRSVHIDADAAVVLFEHGYTTTYRRGFAPEWLRVLPRKEPARPPARAAGGP